MAEEVPEQIPHQHIIDELQAQLNAKMAELVVANARIRTRDEKIARLQAEQHTTPA